MNGGLDGVGRLGERSALVVPGVLADAPGERDVAWAWGVGPQAMSAVISAMPV